jgi:hypothetical protein
LRFLESGYGSTTMNEEKRKRLESKWWRVGSTREFLDLSQDEEAPSTTYFVP